MPHTTRKKRRGGGSEKKNIVHTKRKEILDEEGWIHVIDKPSKPRPTNSLNATELQARIANIGADFERDGFYYVERTREEMGVEYARAKKAWGGSEARLKLGPILEGLRGDMEEGREVKKIVVLGLGSLQNARNEARKSSFTQLVAVESMIDVFGNGEQIPVFLQDPVFADTDLEFISSLSYRVLENPNAFQEIDENTLVYGVHCYTDVYEQVSKQPRPAIVICTEVELFEGKTASDETMQNMKDMVEGCESVQFPQMRNEFSDTVIYWRKKAVEGRVVEEEKSAIEEKSTEEKPTEEQTPPEKTRLAEETTITSETPKPTEEPTEEPTTFLEPEPLEGVKP